MPDSEKTEMTELLKTLRGEIVNIQGTLSAKLLKQAGGKLSDVYRFHLSARQHFTEVEYYLKNLYSSYNYAAALINEATKKRSIGAEEALRIDECLEAMIRCCDVTVAHLNKVPSPQTKKKKK